MAVGSEVTMFSRMLAVAGVALVAGLPVAWALHEIDHRYDVTGFVLDANEQPVVGSPVSIRLANEVIGYQETNAQGYYRIRVHLHDADLGKTLQLKTAAGEATIRVRFAPGDDKTERVHYANIVGGKLVEDPLARQRYPLWLYVAGALLVIAVAAVIIGRRRARRPRVRQQTARAARRRRKRRR